MRINVVALLKQSGTFKRDMLASNLRWLKKGIFCSAHFSARHHAIVNCYVDVAIFCAGFQSNIQQEKSYSSGFLRFLYLASLTFELMILFVAIAGFTIYACARDDLAKK